MKDKKNLLVSFSGGETSAYMVQWLLQNKSDEYNMLFVIANTSKERKETLEFANKVDQKYNLNLKWIECKFDSEKRIGYNLTEYENLKTNGEIFEQMIIAYGLPNNEFPHCTRELKTSPIQAYAKKYFKNQEYWTAIGIRADEIDRVNSNRIKNKIYYPLVEANITKADVNAFWRDQEFRLNLKGYEGNCDLCWKKSTRKLLTLIVENPEIINWWQEMEDKYSLYIPSHRNRTSKKLPIYMYRGGTSTFDLLKMSKEEFDKANDDAINYYRQESLWGYDLDSSNGCEESCEVF